MKRGFSLYCFASKRTSCLTVIFDGSFSTAFSTLNKKKGRYV